MNCLFLVCVSVALSANTVNVANPAERRSLPGVVDCPVGDHMDVLIDRPAEGVVEMRPTDALNCNVMINNKAYRLNKWTWNTEPQYYPAITGDLEAEIAAGNIRALQVSAQLLPADPTSADYEAIYSSGWIWGGDSVAADDEAPLPIPPVGAKDLALTIPVDATRRLFLKEKPKTLTERAVDLALVRDTAAEKPRLHLYYELPLEASPRLARALHTIGAPPVTMGALTQARDNATPAEGIHVTLVTAGGPPQ